MKLLSIAVIACSLCGCTQYVMDSAIASWQSQPLSSVITAWGAPTEELKFEGKQMYLWYTYDGKPAAANSRKPSSLKDSEYCLRLLESDRAGKIVHGAWEGNDCPWVFSRWAR